MPKSTLAESLGSNPTIEKNIPEDVEWIDDAFYIKETRYGLYTSVLKNPLGANFLTGATRDGILQTTRWHLKCLQDDTLHLYTRVVNATSGVKL
tara:strand:- start:184 stop:465 length:282 start_codon:yes stop_codon:yes gene_type:complete